MCAMSDLFNKSFEELTAMFNAANDEASRSELGSAEKAQALAAMDNINAMISIKRVQAGGC